MRERLAKIRENIARACGSVGRDPTDVVLVAVSKTVSPDLMLRAYELGVRDFGESRLQEAQTKVHSLPPDVTWHFIGKLQSNKARKVGGLFSVVHTIESENQLKELAKCDRTLEGLIEVNIGREPQKAGVFSERLDETVRLLSHYNNVRFRGLMTIGPETSDPEQSRQVFRELKGLGDKIGAGWLSMGMSGDYVVAVQEGSTHVRIGSALFGERG